MRTEAYLSFCRRTEKNLPWLTPAGLAAGLLAAWLAPASSSFFHGALDHVLSAYALLAPAAIFLVLAPALARLLASAPEKNSHAGAPVSATRMIAWLCLQRFWALLLAVTLAGVIFRLPLTPAQYTGMLSAVRQSLQSLGDMALRGSYFHAVYAAVLAALLAKRYKRMEALLEKSASVVELLGQAMVPAIPLFMAVMGMYLIGLPQHLRLDLGGLTPGLQAVWAYGLATMLTALACILWHGFLLWRCRMTVPGFSVKTYGREYWLRIYPLLWSTASESLCAPLNLHLIKKVYPGIPPVLRRFVVGIGSYLNVNGTMLCAVMLLGLVCGMLGIPLSWTQLLFCVPLLFLLGFAVPGLPGELLLFAGPLMAFLAITPPLAGPFLALYVTLQLGLPDSFRTGNNSTDSCLLALLLSRQRK